MSSKSAFALQRVYTRPGRTDGTFGDFMCMHCGAFVPAGSEWSGVRHRNHCPHCLSSRHLDHFEAGDRLSACRARMEPIGLTLKQSAKKYSAANHGELMIVHRCEGCGKLSINRIAADDDAERLAAIFDASATLDDLTHRLLYRDGITLLGADEAHLLEACLWGVRTPGR